MPPEPPSPNSGTDNLDEWIAVAIALLSMGGIVYWGMGRPTGLVTLFQPQTSSSEVAPDPATETFGLPEGNSATDAEEPTQDDRLSSFQAPLEELDRLDTLSSDRPDDEITMGTVVARSFLITRSSRPSPSPSASATDAESNANGTSSAEVNPAPSLSNPNATPSEPSDGLPENSPPVAATVIEAPSAAPTTAETPAIAFADVPDGYWAKPYIDQMVQRRWISGFQDQSFQPDAPMTRAQFAALIQTAFSQSDRQISIPFQDVAADYWAKDAIETAVKTGFMSGYPGQIFRPNEPITRLQVLLSLNSGMQLPPSSRPVAEVLQSYQDQASAPVWAIPAIAATTEAGIVISPSTPPILEPNRPATRAEVIAMVYQALVWRGVVEPVETPYVVQP